MRTVERRIRVVGAKPAERSIYSGADLAKAESPIPRNTPGFSARRAPLSGDAVMLRGQSVRMLAHDEEEK